MVRTFEVQHVTSQNPKRPKPSWSKTLNVQKVKGEGTSIRSLLAAWASLCACFKQCMLIHTWCDCLPADTPTRWCVFLICFEVEVDNITPCNYLWWHEVLIVAFVILLWGVAAAFVHQDCPIAIRDFDMVALTLGTIPYGKVVEIQHQDLTPFPLYCLCLFDIVRISSREFWWGDHTFIKEDFYQKEINGVSYSPMLPQPPLGHLGIFQTLAPASAPGVKSCSQVILRLPESVHRPQQQWSPTS